MFKNRGVVGERMGAVGVLAEEPKDEYGKKLMKFIPGEIVVLYMALINILFLAKNQDLPFDLISWIIFGVGIVGTAVYIWNGSGTRNEKKINVIISVIAFVIWVYTLGGPFLSLSWYNSIYGALLLPVYTFFIPF